VSVNLGSHRWSPADKIDGPASLYFAQDSGSQDLNNQLFRIGQFVNLGAGNDGKKRKT
jgi:hypothetical protein